MSKIWCSIIILSIGISFFIGTSDGVLGIITESSAKSIENIIVIAAMTCFWSGIFNVLRHTKIITVISKILKPIILKIFGGNLNKEEIENISLNMASNLIGVGNAATVFAIKAIEEMQKNNTNKSCATKNMALFVLINTASVQLIPTNMVSMRMLYGSSNANSIIIPNFIVSIVSLIIGIIALNIIFKVKQKC